jgi:hypothetical protein
MLQIITGKFFTSDACHVTRQRAILHTNYRTHWDLETDVGALRVVDTSRDVATFVYEVDQRIEQASDGGFGLVATPPDSLVNDFAALVSFALDVTCTPDSELTRRLTQTPHPALGVPHVPRRYIGRVFEPRVEFAQGDADRVRTAARDLVALERRSYEAAMRAIRRYVTGLHRLGDDLDLAYTLLVASMESLAQDFDAFTPTWLDFPQDKRTRIDKALLDIDEAVADRVRDALLMGEHLALARRFREFALAHLGPDFFRDEARGRVQPVGRSALRTGLEQAYFFRSSYVHTLRHLPRVLTDVAWEGESFDVDGKPGLTFRGLARVARSVIAAFIARRPKVEREVFDWRSSLPGLVSLQVAPRYWIWRVEGFDHQSARRYLNGFLGELTTALVEPGSGLTDIRDVLGKVEKLAPALGRENRLPMLTLYLLYHRYLSLESGHRTEWADFISRFEKDFDDPSLESLLAHALLGEALPWSEETVAGLWDRYRIQRYHKNGLRIPPLLEAAVTLWLAESARLAGDPTRVRALVGVAVEDFPGHEGLRSLEERLEAGMELPIDWRAVLLPPAVMPVDGALTPEEGAPVGAEAPTGEEREPT